MHRGKEATMAIEEDELFLMDDRSLLLDETKMPKLTPQQQAEIDAKCAQIIEEYLEISVSTSFKRRAKPSN